MNDSVARLVEIGRREPTAALLAQAKYSMRVAEQHRSALAEHGFGDREMRALKEAFDQASSAFAAHGRSLIAADARAREESRALDSASTVMLTLRNALAIVIRDEDPAEAVEQAIGWAPLRRSAAVLERWLEQARPYVVRFDSRLRPYFRGESPVQMLDAAREALARTVAAQAQELEGLPGETLPLFEAKGRLLEAIEDLNRVARIAFHGRSDVLARFNKDILVRARRGRTVQPSLAMLEPAFLGSA